MTNQETRPNTVYQFKVTLKDIRPPIWRRFQVPNSITLYKLHLVLQEVMGWFNCHLYEFIIRSITYGDPDPEYGQTDFNSRRVRLWQVISKPRSSFTYVYDFGDDWRHQVILEKVIPSAEELRYAVCLAGARACPPEDCGGPCGYERLLEIISNPEHEEYHEMIEWLGGGFDPEVFDLYEVNMRLRQIRLR
ncbi:MAG: plasmid pRiA4b ORF-3 family protein [Candidatus Fermentithermobacillus carboniphilus]|uniref:Plasmid pRiA4b ORF-3 family protein n=1 Tax=Candidatus Fermentithermobacillus carboniphilus TaxID=3085328 RepID=A0AAT9LDL3_9FIRM|nr:MAG: plasmid pRiA4b ORF-3 family protein [Candidatus Fermentithermobacillus carboniphilus]